MQRHHTPLALGQVFDRNPDPGRLDGGEHDRFGSGARVRQYIRPAVATSGVQRHHGEPTAAGPATRRSADQPQEPGGERDGVFEAGDVTERQHERFLGDVGGLVQIAAQADGGGHRDVLEAVDERRPGRGIPAPGGLDQRHPTLPVLDQGHH